MLNNDKQALNSQELPFFARYLEGQFCEDLSEEEMDEVHGGLRYAAVTLKYPSDNEDGSGGSGTVTRKYPSDHEDSGFVTKKYPSDHEDSGFVTEKYPSDSDEIAVTQKYPSDGDDYFAGPVK